MAKKSSKETDQKLYEVAFLLTDPAEEKEIANLLGKYKATIVFRSPVTDLKLAYPIKKHTAAYFGYIQFELKAEDVLLINQTLKLNNKVLRFLIVTSVILNKTSEKREEPRRRVKTTEESSSKPVLTNEALSEKLEEILK
ncbi:MAG: 30S ribosomal protein S6 [Candidatus Pacebacteria bacterium]|nr:30S ribosomal protein S6 [Candidatus Paceibacterota bacterium]